MRSLVGLVAIVGMLVALQSGALTAVFTSVGSALTEAVVSRGPSAAPRVAGVVGGGTPAAVPDVRSSRLSCAAFDPADSKRLASLKLTATETVKGCDWALPAKPGTSAARIVRIFEDAGTFGLSPMVTRSAKDKKPVVGKGYSREGWTTTIWVAKGVRVKAGSRSVTAKRSTWVVVSHEALGLTEKQGRSLALTITAEVSSLPVRGAADPK